MARRKPEPLVIPADSEALSDEALANRFDEEFNGAMPDSELASILGEHERRSVGYYESEIAQDQENALNRYYRRDYGDERAGRSKVKDGTVAIVVDNAVAALLKPFASSDETVVFEPRSKEDEEQAAQATEYVNYVLHHDNCGFLVLHDWFKDALLQKLGVVKVYWEDYTREKVVRLEHLDATQVQQMQAEGVLQAAYGPDEFDLYTADVLKTEPDGKLCVENVPPEEYRISPLARPGRVPPYEAHVTRKTRSELLEMKFDRAVVMSLAKRSGGQSEDGRSMARRQDEGWEQGDAPGGEANEEVDFNDEFVLVDYDGDGFAELRRVMRSNDVILYNEEVEYGLFAKLCPIPMPHKVYGLALADIVIDDQRINTTVLRQTMDNLYLHNNPRPIIGEQAERDDGSTIEDLIADVPGAALRAKDASQFSTMVVPFVGDKSLAMLDYFASQTEARTGITKHGQGMDPDAIDNAGQITATQAAIMQDGRNSRAEMIARIFAETGIKDLFKLMLKLLVEHQPRARMIRLRNKWVEMDPRSWNAEMDVAVSVGLGTGNRAENMAMAEGVLQLMERLGQSPMAPLIDSEKVYNAVKKFLNAAGIKNIDDFVNEPQRDEQGNVIEPPAPPSPEEQKLQAEMQLKAAELQARQAEGEQKMQLAREEAAAKMELERQKAEAEMVMNQQRMEQELILERERMAMQHQVAMEQARQKEAFAARDADRRDAETSSKIKKNRSGGDLDK